MEIGRNVAQRSVIAYPLNQPMHNLLQLQPVQTSRAIMNLTRWQCVLAMLSNIFIFGVSFILADATGYDWLSNVGTFLAILTSSLLVQRWARQ